MLAQAHYVPSLTEPSGEPWLCNERFLVKTTELVCDADQIRAHVMQNSKAPGYAAFELWPIQVGPDMTLFLIFLTLRGHYTNIYGAPTVCLATA